MKKHFAEIINIECALKDLNQNINRINETGKAVSVIKIGKDKFRVAVIKPCPFKEVAV